MLDAINRGRTRYSSRFIVASSWTTRHAGALPDRRHYAIPARLSRALVYSLERDERRYAPLVT